MSVVPNALPLSAFTASPPTISPMAPATSALNIAYSVLMASVVRFVSQAIAMRVFLVSLVSIARV